MCLTCGCSHSHDHTHSHGHDHHHHHHHDAPIGAVHDHEISKARAIKIEEDILAENNRYAEANREILAKHKILAINLVSSPGSGKTTLLTKTLETKKFPVAVIEGDQQTDIDAKRIRATGVPVVQINTGKGCHLDAHMVGHALEDLKLDSITGGVLFIENVGNLVCPSAFDLGEAAKVVLVSVTEGDDKPLKYPDMFSASRLMLITKIDLLPYVQFSIDSCIANARKINPDLEAIKLSCFSGEGVTDWLEWINKNRENLAGKK